MSSVTDEIEIKGKIEGNYKSELDFRQNRQAR